MEIPARMSGDFFVLKFRKATQRSAEIRKDLPLYSFGFLCESL